MKLPGMAYKDQVGRLLRNPRRGKKFLYPGQAYKDAVAAHLRATRKS